jgi:RimJ/RimL family protein N-acetyltransferase
MIQGRITRLRSPEKEDIPHALKWFEDTDYHYFLGGDPLVSDRRMREVMLAQINRPSLYDSNIYLIIEDRENRPIGLVLFHSISWKNRNAIMEIYLEGGKRNRVYGIDACLTAVQYAFEELNLHKIAACIFAYNERMIKVVERAGAKREQIFRKHVFRRGNYHDVYVYGLLRAEWEELKEDLKGHFIGRE